MNLARARDAWRTARFDRAEISGSLGDLGTFLPLLVAMASQNGLSFAAALFFAGLFNLVTGLSFGIPMAVQPMKAIAAIALAHGLSAAQIVAAGMSVSAVVLVLGISGAIDLVHRVIARRVVRGLQLALGLTLAIKGVKMAAAGASWFALDGHVTALLAAAAVVLLFESKRVPSALVLFAAGLAIAIASEPAALGELSPSLWWPSWSPPRWSDFESSFTLAALPQIPLTTLNSVIAVCALSSDLFPQHPAPPRRVALSVGLMNLLAGWFGAMPMCHGAGGLAGQHRFGARTSGSILVLGAAKMALAVVFGGSLMALCAAFPGSVLGVMLAFSGIELAAVVRDQKSAADVIVMLATAAACLALDDFALGVLIGIAFDRALHLALRARA